MTDRANPADELARLEELAALVPVLEAPDAVFGRWEGQREDAEGRIHLPYFEPGPACDAFRAAVGRGGWLIVGFDWPGWARADEAQALWKDPAALAAATPDQLARFLTALIRSERFSEGTLDEAFESGLLARIARRAAVLAAELRARADAG
jgi:Family of unknown function (DUF6508)